VGVNTEGNFKHIFPRVRIVENFHAEVLQNIAEVNC